MTQVVARPATGARRGDARRGGRRLDRLDRWTLALAALSAGLVGLGFGLGWRGVDLPAQLFRVDQFRAHGFSLWDSQWYAGHWALDYSLLYPALGAVVGVGLLAVLSAAAATAAYDRILVAAFGPAGRVGSVIFALSVIVETAIGQLAFFTGLAFALTCVWALLGPRRRPPGSDQRWPGSDRRWPPGSGRRSQPSRRPGSPPPRRWPGSGRRSQPSRRRRPGSRQRWQPSGRRWLVAGVLAVAATATSPLAGAFLALALAAWCLAVLTRRRPVLPRDHRPGIEVEASGRGEGWCLASIGLLALLPIAVTSVLFPGQGPMPYPVIDWLWETVVALLVWMVAPRGMRALRIGVAIYALVLLGSVAVPSPLGGNVGRMEDAFALSLVAACCWTRREAATTAWPLGRWLSGRVAPAAVTRGFRIALVGLAVPLFLSQWDPAWQAMTADAGHSWTHRAYYAPLVAWLGGELGRPPAARVEVVPTLDHWEAAFVAPSVPLARGWDRQLDEADNPLFYGKAPLSAQTYVAWLEADGVRYVALAGAPLDAAGVGEARLLDAGVPGLRLVWHTAEWRVWEVTGGPGLITGPARLRESSEGRVDLDASATGPVLVRVRWAAHWEVAGGDARLAEAAGGWTTVTVERPGRISLRARLGW